MLVGIVAIALWVMKLTVSSYGLIVCGAAIAGLGISPKNWWAHIATFTRHAEVPGFRSAGVG